MDRVRLPFSQKDSSSAGGRFWFAETNLSPPSRAGRGTGLLGVTSLQSGREQELQMRKVVLDISRFLITGCRAQPCRRKCETHRGFHYNKVPEFLLLPYLHDPLLPVLESTLLAQRFIAALRFDPLYFPLALPLRLALAIRLATTPALLALPIAAWLRTPSIGRHYLDRAHCAVAGRARRDHRIVLQRQMDHAAVARRHRLQPHRLMLALGFLAHRQRHPMQLLAAARAIRFSLERNRCRVLDSPRQDPVDDIFERIERLPMPSDQDPR